MQKGKNKVNQVNSKLTASMNVRDGTVHISASKIYDEDYNEDSDKNYGEDDEDLDKNYEEDSGKDFDYYEDYGYEEMC